MKRSTRAMLNLAAALSLSAGTEILPPTESQPDLSPSRDEHTRRILAAEAKRRRRQEKRVRLAQLQAQKVQP